MMLAPWHLGTLFPPPADLLQHAGEARIAAQRLERSDWSASSRGARVLSRRSLKV
jgi:hypothetical protein